MTKFSFLVVSLSLSYSAMGAPLRWSLPCSIERNVKIPAHVARYQVTKIAFPNPKPTVGNKWSHRYVVEVFFKSSPTKAYAYPLVPDNNGDEDYNDYRLTATGPQMRTINVQGAAIQNAFRWATLINVDGSGFASCRPRSRD